MIRIERKEDCCGCQACAQICPKQCISMDPDEEGFLYPRIDAKQCVQCGLCEKVCPVLRRGEEPEGEPEAYAACSHSEEVRQESSSGGIFSLLAEKVLGMAGVVYGAAMTTVDTVRHIRVSSPEELPQLRGSKYVQSDIGDSYLRAREDLMAGRVVLFTGTPCQIEGLRSFLGKDFPNLICMDIVCHGVPSPMVWRSYLQYRQRRAGSRAVRAAFRNKRFGWKDFSVVLDFSNGSHYISSFVDDPFMQAYLHDLCLRPSCYECAFKKTNRVSDLTAADFWGISKVCPQMDDDRGTSLVLVHSEKGERVLRELFGDMRYEQVDFTCAIQGNPSMSKPVNRPQGRESFLKELQRESLPEVVRRYVNRKPGVKRRVKAVLRQLGLR